MKLFSFSFFLFVHVATLPKFTHSQVCKDDETFSSGRTDCSNCGGNPKDKDKFCKKRSKLKIFCKRLWIDDKTQKEKKGFKWCKKTCDPVSSSCPTDGGACPEKYSQPSNYQEKACNEVIFPYRASTIPNTPSSWSKTNCFTNSNARAAYDLALVGAGIGSAYVANELRFGHAHGHAIAVFEAGDTVGGRLLSAFQAGALGIPVRPFDLETNVAPPEYGGMRTSTIYTLVFKQVIRLWEKDFKKQYPNAICTKDFCDSTIDPYKCCQGLLTPMDVGNVGYFSTRTELGPNLMSSSLKDPNPLYPGDFTECYSVTDIKNYANYPPFVQCILLVIGVQKYSDETGSGKIPATKGFNYACNDKNCAMTEGFCGLCGLFPKPAAAATSCSGYDTDPNVLSTDNIIGLMDEVVNIKGKTFLYLFTVGYQRLVQELFSGTMSGNIAEGEGRYQYNTLDIAPQFGKKLVAVGVGSGNFDDAVERARTLAKIQIQLYKDRSTERVENGHNGPIRLMFEDGSVTTSHMAYLTMLPFDAVGDKMRGVRGVRGLEPWEKIVHKGIANPTSLFKAVLAWDTFSLAEKLNLKPCVVIRKGTAGGGPCDRIILDGNQSSQVVRQAWLWDYKQILLYANGADGTPSQNDIDVTTKHGMEAFVKKAVAELQFAVKEYNITIPPPAWFRSKSWPMGAVLTDWALNVNGTRLSDYFRRPFGSSVSVWYGNSEMAEDGDLHGWAEGALSMANTSLPELKTELGLLKPTTASPSESPTSTSDPKSPSASPTSTSTTPGPTI